VLGPPSRTASVWPPSLAAPSCEEQDGGLGVTHGETAGAPDGCAHDPRGPGSLIRFLPDNWPFERVSLSEGESQGWHRGRELAVRPCLDCLQKPTDLWTSEMEYQGALLAD
jgi:hypothetical protein